LGCSQNKNSIKFYGQPLKTKWATPAGVASEQHQGAGGKRSHGPEAARAFSILKCQYILTSAKPAL
jgi:hypothetical protein